MHVYLCMWCRVRGCLTKEMETMTEKIEKKIKNYKDLEESAAFIKHAVKIKGISADTAVEALADIVIIMLRMNIKRAEEAKAALESIREGSHLAGL